MPTVVVAVLGPDGPVIVPTDQPIARADDLGLSRGDGAFETIYLRHGSPWLLDAHLDRLAHSLNRLEISATPRADLERLVKTAVSEWEQVHDGDAPEAGLKLVCSRGSEYDTDASPTVYALVFPIPQAVLDARRNGVTLAALNWGFAADVRSKAPWLLGGVKALSYAQNMATLREAQRRGADDVLLVSSDGVILEGPTAGIIWRRGDQLLSTSSDTGILISTTVQFLLDHAEKLGMDVGYQRFQLADLVTMDGGWLCSSVRGVVPITAIITDDTTIELPICEYTTTLRDLIPFP